jgi:hypothetical protein
MAEQSISLTASQASPSVAQQLSLTSSEYHQLRGVRFSVSNDNASASVAYELVISRSSTPLDAGSVVAAGVIQRGDPYIVTGSMPAGASEIRGRLDDSQIVLDTEELLDEGTYLGLRATGLESGKELEMAVSVETEALSKTSARNSEYLQQALRFQNG